MLDLAGTPLDEFPDGVKALNGVMTVVNKDGQHMLMASSPSDLLITLPQVLPAEFTVEADLIPKRCCAPDDIMLEGTPTRNRGVASAELTWHPERISAVGGGGEMYQSNLPEDLAAAVPGNLTHLVFTFSGTTIKLYTNGRRLYTLEKQFVRGRVLRVWLGGESATNPMYLAAFRISEGMWAPQVVAKNAPDAFNQQPDTSGQPSKLGKSNLTVVTPDTTTPRDTSTSSLTVEQQKSGMTVGSSSASVLGLRATVDDQAQATLSWQAVQGATSYFVVRWLVGHPECCSETSQPAGMYDRSWKGPALVRAGTYGYRVYAYTPTKIYAGETTLQYPTPLWTMARMMIGSSGPLGVLLAWGVYPDATAYRVYRSKTPQEPGVLLGTVSADPFTAFGDEGMSAAMDVDLSPGGVSNLSYWVQAILPDGTLSDPGPVTPMGATIGSSSFLGPVVPSGITPQVGGTTTITFNGQQGRGSKVKWDWNPEPPERQGSLYFATVEFAQSVNNFTNGWTLLRSDLVQAPGAPLIPYVQQATASGPPYTTEVPAGMYVRFCLSYFPMPIDQRNVSPNPACVVSVTPP